MLAQLKAFLRAPFDKSDATASPMDKLRALLSLLVADLGFALVAGLAIGLVEKLELVNMSDHAVAGAFREMNVWQVLITAVLIFPLVEELIFRLPLRYQTNPFAGLARLLTPRTNPEIETSLAAQRREWWDKYYSYIFYGLTVAFALVHLLNYPELSLGLLLVSPVLVAPQFVMGAMAGFLRVRMGFLWAYLLHLLHNLALVGLAVLGTTDVEVITVDNEDFRLTVEEVSPLDQELNHSWTFGSDTLAYNKTPLTKVIWSLEGEAEGTVVAMPRSQRDVKLNVRLKQLSGERGPKTLLSDTLLAHYGLRVSPEMRGDTLVVVKR